MVVDVVIPAFNEALSIGKVLKEIPRDLVRNVIVVDNGSTDGTPDEAGRSGAIVLSQPLKGYGSACLKGLEYLSALPLEQQPGIVVFLDADYSDFPEEMPALVRPISGKGFDLVIGSRVLGKNEPGALQPHQVLGNRLSTFLIRVLYNYRFSDLGPFRAIRWEVLKNMNMQDKNFGWTVEMQVRAAKMKIRCTEVPVRYRKRLGVSKVSGTVKGSILAGYKIIWTIFKLW